MPDAWERKHGLNPDRDLTIGGFCTSPLGRQYLGYVGNVPLTSFDGPPPEVLKLVGVG